MSEPLSEARRKLRTADHILTQTYAMVKDPRLLVVVLRHVHDAVDDGLRALLEDEFARKRVAGAGGSFEERLALLRPHAERLALPHGFFGFAQELHELLLEHQKSQVEFSRRSEFVICDDAYRVRTLSEDALKKDVERARAFLAIVEAKHAAVPA